MIAAPPLGTVIFTILEPFFVESFPDGNDQYHAIGVTGVYAIEDVSVSKLSTQSLPDTETVGTGLSKILTCKANESLIQPLLARV